MLLSTFAICQWSCAILYGVCSARIDSTDVRKRVRLHKCSSACSPLCSPYYVGVSERADLLCTCAPFVQHLCNPFVQHSRQHQTDFRGTVLVLSDLGSADLAGEDHRPHYGAELGLSKVVEKTVLTGELRQEVR